MLDTGFRLGVLKNGSIVVGMLDVNDNSIVTDIMLLGFDPNTSQVGVAPIALPFTDKLPRVSTNEFLLLCTEDEINNKAIIKGVYQKNVNKLKHPNLIIPNSKEIKL